MRTKDLHFLNLLFERLQQRHPQLYKLLMNAQTIVSGESIQFTFLTIAEHDEFLKQKVTDLIFHLANTLPAEYGRYTRVQTCIQGS